MGRVFHAGPYDGDDIEMVVELDPEYILWAAANEPEHQIAQSVIDRAQQLLDEPEPWLDDDDLDDEVQALTFGRSRYEYE